MKSNVAAFCVVAAAASLTPSSAVKIAFVGNTGTSTTAAAVYDMIKAQQVQVVVQTGGLDMNSNPAGWKNFLDARAQGLEVLATSGNYEADAQFGSLWNGVDGYKDIMFKKQAPAATAVAKCRGRDGKTLEEDYGEFMSCEMGNIMTVMIGWDQLDTPEALSFVEQRLTNTQANHRVCVWDRPEGSLNPGDEHEGYYSSHKMYEVCRQFGAIVTNGMASVYARTKVVDNYLWYPNVSPTSSANPTVSCGATISLVVGMGGGLPLLGPGRYSDEPQFEKYITNYDSDVLIGGALVCDTGDNPDSTTMSCQFISSAFKPLDQFVITRNMDGCGGISVLSTAKIEPLAIVSEMNQRDTTPIVVGGAVAGVLAVGAVALVMYRKTEEKNEQVREIRGGYNSREKSRGQQRQQLAYV